MSNNFSEMKDFDRPSPPSNLEVGPSEVLVAQPLIAAMGASWLLRYKTPTVSHRPGTSNCAMSVRMFSMLGNAVNAEPDRLRGA